MQIHVRAPVSSHCASSSYRGSFVNSFCGRAQALGASLTRGSSLRSRCATSYGSASQPQDRETCRAGARSAKADGDHDVTAASRPVKAFVPVRIRLVTPFGRVQTLRWAEVDRLSSTIRRAYVRGASLGGPGSIPGMECLRSITPLAHPILRNGAAPLSANRPRP